MIVFTAGIAFAKGPPHKAKINKNENIKQEQPKTTKEMPAAQQNSQNKNKANKAKTNKGQTNKAVMEQVKPLVKCIRENKTEMNKLRAQIKNKHQLLQDKIDQLSQDKDSLTQEQIEKLQNSLETVKQTRQLIENTKGKIDDQCINLGQAKKKYNAENAEQSLNNIISIQKERIQALDKILEELDSILNI